MPRTPTVGQFLKAAASSPQQACVMVYRDDYRTLVWDDKLTASVDTAESSVPADQCLTFDHDQFEVIQQALRTGRPLRQILLIVQGADGLYEFSASPECESSVGAARLYFDHLEYSAFVQAVKQNEFERSAFLWTASGR
ncbi:MAG: hypothetical protein JWN03_4231 [Nocardia sp.]|uniref:hypothetical protein n=1 Tax=Nocardia sp. TaxID=1821 RepID=UPI002622600B|nr:hypothetical protein [Nocardia sp.]MCU1643956.1 hypothetical protein [Nocardia sp.]